MVKVTDFKGGILTGLLLILFLFQAVAQTGVASALTNAEQSYDAGNYKAALAAYKYAQKQDPENATISAKIVTIEKILAEQQAQKEEYDASVEQVENFVAAGEYQKAIGELQSTTLTIKPNDDWAVTRLSEIEKLLADNAAKEAEWLQKSQDAEKLYTNGKLVSALEAYQEALAIFPSKTVTKEKIIALEQEIAMRDNNYNDAVKRGDEYYRNDQLNEALTTFQEAKEIKPEESYPQQKISQLEGMLQQMEQYRGEYDKIMVRAEAFFAQERYDIAKEEYLKAIDIMPIEVKPKERLEEIAAIEMGNSNREEAYQVAMQQGKSAMENSNWTSAQELFRRALKLKEGDTDAQEKLQEVSLKISAERSAEEGFQTLVSQGADAIEKEEWEIAKEKYSAAAEVKPDDSHVLAQLKVVEAELKKIDDQYSNFVAQGELLFEKQEYEKAIVAFQTAATLKPREYYPKERIGTINNLQRESNMELEGAYQQAVANGDLFFLSGEFEEAESAYKTALSVKPIDSYAENKIIEVKEAAKQEEDKGKRYQTLIAEADRNRDKSEHMLAIEGYQNALKLYEDKLYPKEEISKLEEVVKQLADTETTYTQLLAKADTEYENRQFDEARATYVSVLEIKPKEEYPTIQIALIDKEVARLERIEINYNEAIKSADILFGNQNWMDAKSQYDKALGFKPEERYPQEKINEIDAVLNALANKETAYEEAMQAGNTAFDQKQWQTALSFYNMALNLKSDELIPARRKETCEYELQKIAEQKAEYDALIALADNNHANNQLENALTNYQKALVVMPKDAYAQQRITEISQTLTDIELRQQQYDSYITQGDDYVKVESYLEAKEAYSTALSLHPEEGYPKERLAFVETKLLAIRDKNQAYANAIQQGDTYFKNQQYNEAISSYTSAQELDITDSYPKQQILLAQQELQKISDRNEAFDRAIQQGDLLMSQQKLAAAKVEYQAALSLKPEEVYPRQKVEEINGVLLDIANKEQRYGELISAADKAVADGLWLVGIENYNKALVLKPEQQYPVEKITLCEAAIAQENANKEQYTKAIDTADQLFLSQKWEEAKVEYEKAVRALPAQDYPKERITEINTIVSDISERESRYNGLIEKGNTFLNQQKFDESIAAYSEAAPLYPDNSYADEQITLVKEAKRRFVEDKKEQDYTTCLNKGDVHFARREFVEASAQYELALAIYPESQDAINKIEACSTQLSSLAQNREREAQYVIKYADAQQAMASRDYVTANVIFEKLVAEHPDKSEAFAGLELTKEILASIKTTEERYTQLMSDADGYLKSNAYGDAFTTYLEASALKYGDAQAESNIASIISLLKNNSLEPFSGAIELKNNTVKQLQLPDNKNRDFQGLLVYVSKPENDCELVINYGYGNDRYNVVFTPIRTFNQITTYLIDFSNQNEWNSYDIMWLKVLSNGADLSVKKIELINIK